MKDIIIKKGKIAIYTSEGYYLLLLAKLMYLKSDLGMVEVHSEELGSILLTLVSLNQFEKKLKRHGFTRARNNFLVNQDYIRLYHPGKGLLKLTDGKEIDIPQEKKEDFWGVFKKLCMFIFKK